LIKILMERIKDSITQCVTSILLKRNLIPRFMKGGGSTRNDKKYLDVKKRNWDIEKIEKKEFFLISHAAIPS
jgi:hypothetical protein